MYAILEMQFPILFYRFVYLQIFLRSCPQMNTMGLMIRQHWFMEWLGAVRQHVITWTNVDQDLSSHMSLLGHNGLMAGTCSPPLPPHGCQATAKWQWSQSARAQSCGRRTLVTWVQILSRKKWERQNALFLNSRSRNFFDSDILSSMSNCFCVVSTWPVMSKLNISAFFLCSSRLLHPARVVKYVFPFPGLLKLRTQSN